MKNKIILLLFAFCFSLVLFAQNEGQTDFVYTNREKIYPSAKRPKAVSSEKISEAAEKNLNNAGKDYVEKKSDVFKFGLESQIIELLTELTENQDPRFVDVAYDLFLETKSPSVKEKLIRYFSALKDPCLEDFTVDVINDPYDEKSNIVEASFLYLESVKSKDAVPGLIDLLEKDDSYFTQALSALGECGGSLEAQYLASYIDKPDLTTVQKQALVKVLGKLKAVETFDKLRALAEDQNENTFVRMYAAQAMGSMEKSEAEDILVSLYEEENPNFRVYVLKGLSYYNGEKSRKVLLQALRDSNYKVRLEAIENIEKLSLGDAVPYLTYRCKDAGEESVVKNKCYKTLAALNTAESNNFLISLLQDEKTADSTKGRVAQALLEHGNGKKEVADLAIASLADKKKLSLSYALGKEIAKYSDSSFEKVCAAYIASKDVAAQGTGLDMFAKGKYSSVRATVEELAKPAIEAEKDEKKQKTASGGNVNAQKAKRILDYLNGK